jgi:hypothetical protein
VSDQGWPVGGGYRVDLLTEQEAVSAQDVIDLWTTEGVLAPDEAQRRAGEILLVGTHESHGLVGVSTVYLHTNPQLRAVLWHQRNYVSPAHRGSLVGVWLGIAGRRHLDAQYADGGGDRSAIGILWEVENPGLKRAFPQALWMPTEFTFIGTNARGDDVRVHYFPGALAPEPDQGST